MTLITWSSSSTWHELWNTYHISQGNIQEHSSSQRKDPVGREVAAGQDAEAQTHVAAAGGKEVEEESLLEAHASVEQDDKVSYGGRENRGEGVGRRVTLGRGTDSTMRTGCFNWIKSA